jgi:hypothetical protein
VFEIKFSIRRHCARWPNLCPLISARQLPRRKKIARQSG